jgi:hypothetical protein
MAAAPHVPFVTDAEIDAAISRLRKLPLEFHPVDIFEVIDDNPGMSRIM